MFSCATLNETFTAKYDGVLPRTPQVRPKSEIYTPKRDDEHPHLIHMPSPPRAADSTIIMSRTLKVTGNHVMYDRGV